MDFESRFVRRQVEGYAKPGQIVRGELINDDLERAAKPTYGTALHHLMYGYTRQSTEQDFNRRLEEVK